MGKWDDTRSFALSQIEFPKCGRLVPLSLLCSSHLLSSSPSPPSPRPPVTSQEIVCSFIHRSLSSCLVVSLSLLLVSSRLILFSSRSSYQNIFWVCDACPCLFVSVIARFLRRCIKARCDFLVNSRSLVRSRVGADIAICGLL